MYLQLTEELPDRVRRSATRSDIVHWKTHSTGLHKRISANEHIVEFSHPLREVCNSPLARASIKLGPQATLPRFQRTCLTLPAHRPTPIDRKSNCERHESSMAEGTRGWRQI